MRSTIPLPSPPSPPKGSLTTQSQVLTDQLINHYATKWARGAATAGRRPGARCRRVRAFGPGLPGRARRSFLPARPAAPPARRCPGRLRHMLPAGRTARRGAPCRGGSQPIKSPGFLQPYGPRGEQQCPGPFTSKAAIRGKAPSEIFFLFSLSFLFFFFFKASATPGPGEPNAL